MPRVQSCCLYLQQKHRYSLEKQNWSLELNGEKAQIYFHLPYKLVTDRAEGGLWEEGGRELVTLDIVDFGLFDGSPALVQGEEAFILTVR